MAEGAPFIARQHMHACARGVFAGATRIRIGGSRVSIPSSHVPGRAVAWTCRAVTATAADMADKDVAGRISPRCDHLEMDVKPRQKRISNQRLQDGRDNKWTKSQSRQP